MNNITTPYKKKVDVDDFWNDIYDYSQKPKINLISLNKKHSSSTSTKNSSPVELNQLSPNKKKNPPQNARINHFFALNEIKKHKIENARKNRKDQNTKIEMEECTFYPKIINKKKSKSTEIINSKNNNLSVYERNIKWLNTIKAQIKRIHQVNVLNSCDNAYTPKINKNINFDKVFKNNSAIEYWVKNNRVYLNRHLRNKIVNHTSSSQDNKNIHIYINQMNNDSMWAIRRIEKKLPYNKSLTILHTELLKTAASIEDESKD